MPKKPANEDIEAQEVQTPDINGAADAVLAAVDKKIAEMLLTAEERANEIIAAAEKRAKELDGANTDEETKKANAELEEYVEIKLFKDNGKYKDDVFVSVNGENCLIKRGVKVKIKKKFAQVLEQSDMQDYLTSQLMESKEAEYQAATNALHM